MNISPTLLIEPPTDCIRVRINYPIIPNEQEIRHETDPYQRDSS